MTVPSQWSDGDDREHVTSAAGAAGPGALPLVALVEDDPSMRRAVVRLVRSLGYAVEAYVSAEAFLGHEGGAPPACLILDIHLPGMSGLELARQLRQGASAALAPSIPIVLITALEEDAYRAEADAAAPFVARLRKPFEASVLAAALRAAIPPPAPSAPTTGGDSAPFVPKDNSPE